MELDIEDIKWETLLADKRHKELLSQLKLIGQTLSQKKDDYIVEAIEKQSGVVSMFMQTLQMLSRPEVNVQFEEERMVQAMTKISDNLIILKQSIIEHKREWTFTVKRNREGYIETVNATQIK